MSIAQNHTLTYVPNGLRVEKGNENYLEVRQVSGTDPVSPTDVGIAFHGDAGTVFRKDGNLPTLWTAGLADCAAIATYNGDPRSYSLVHLSGGLLPENDPWGTLVKDTIGPNGYILLIGGNSSSSEVAMQTLEERVKANLAFHKINVRPGAFIRYTRDQDTKNPIVADDPNEEINVEDYIGKVYTATENEADPQDKDRIRLEPSSFVLDPTGHYGRIYSSGKTGTQEPVLHSASEGYLPTPIGRTPASVGEVVRIQYVAPPQSATIAAAPAPVAPPTARPTRMAPASASIVVTIERPAPRTVSEQVTNQNQK